MMIETPVLKLPSPVATPVPLPSPPPFATVLVVDDEPQNRLLLRDPLEARGFAVVEAENGQQALDRVAEQAPDVILLDLMMPGLNGFEVCRKLKQDLATAHIPILMVTALSERKERLMGIQAGANDFLNKPIDIQDVILRVRNAAYAKSLFDRLQAEQEKSERLLLNILPASIAERMKKGEATIADYFPNTTVLVADLVGFTALAAHIGPEQVVAFLNEIFSAFDLLVEKHGLEKIKTIGDAYMAAGGIPSPRPDHASAILDLALGMKEEIKRFNSQYEIAIQFRVGINTGPVVGGIIGRNKFAYDLWGETVNVACRLEASGRAGDIQVSESTFRQLPQTHRFDDPHQVELKGCGEITVHRLA